MTTDSKTNYIMLERVPHTHMFLEGCNAEICPEIQLKTILISAGKSEI